MQKFENMDVIAALEAIMHQNTAYYQSDFAYDIKMMWEAARSDQPEDKLLLWLSRPSGTFCFRERDVLLKDTQAYNTWKFCGEQTHDRILAYAVELTGAANGTVQGNLYELDYQQHYLVALLLQEPQKIVKILGLRNGCIYGGFQLRLPTRALAVRVPLGIALAPVLAGHYHGQAMFLAQPVADAPDVGIALSVGNILSLIHHVHSTEDDVIMDVPFVNVRGQHIRVFAIRLSQERSEYETVE